MWYLDYYDYDTYLHTDPTYLEGWETHPVPLKQGFSQKSGYVERFYCGKKVPFRILPPLERDWQNNHRLVAVSCGGSCIMGLCSCGKVFVDGYVQSGDYYFKSDLVEWEGVKAISLGLNGAVGLRANGTVLVAGYRNLGKEASSAWRNITQVSAGSNYIAALHADGTVLVSEYSGSLAEATYSWRDIVQISAGEGYLLGLRRDGTVVSTPPDDNYGEFSGGCDVSGWTDIVQVSAGASHAAGLRRNGTVVIAETRGFYELIDDVECIDVGMWRNITQVCAGECLTAGLTSDGAVMIARNEKVYVERAELDAVSIACNRCYEGVGEVIALDDRNLAITCTNLDVKDWNNWA